MLAAKFAVMGISAHSQTFVVVESRVELRCCDDVGRRSEGFFQYALS